MVNFYGIYAMIKDFIITYFCTQEKFSPTSDKKYTILRHVVVDKKTHPRRVNPETWQCISGYVHPITQEYCKCLSNNPKFQ
tara:strand:- start:224 stop:466 length:243 start_codon:yes stop_codon:yes gene_type:complete